MHTKSRVVSRSSSSLCASAVVASAQASVASCSADAARSRAATLNSAPPVAGGAGGPSVGARAAFDLARLLLRGDEMGWPSPYSAGPLEVQVAAAEGVALLKESVEPHERAVELLTWAAADGHARARRSLLSMRQESAAGT